MSVAAWVSMVPVIICLTQPASIYGNSQSFPFLEIPATILNLMIYASNDLFSRQMGSADLKVEEFALRPGGGTK